MTINPDAEGSSQIAEAAREAVARGYQPVAIKAGGKRPAFGNWTHQKYDLDTIDEAFEESPGIGLRLGEASNGLVDVDLDHPIAWKLRHLFLPQTPMRTGRVGNPDSHFWYRVTDAVPGYRKYTLPGGETAVELRSSGGHQTLIPPSTWYPKPGSPERPEPYRWESEPWGGEHGPAEITGKQLAVRVATLALVATLVENWPQEGSRHDAYLALAGGMLRFGQSAGVHPYWSLALEQIIEALAEATHDEDGWRVRVGEVIPTTTQKLEAGGKAQGWTTLAGIIGEKSVEKARTIVREIERIVEWERHLTSQQPEPLTPVDLPDDGGGEGDEEDEEHPALPKAVNPLDARANTWEPVGLEPYLAGEVVVPDPTILRRSDGKGIFYPGRVNSLYGRSESAKSWVAAFACLQEIEAGDRVMYVDLEDDPAMAVLRLRLMGAGDDDIRYQFTYIRPEGPHSSMQRDTWGNERPTEIGARNAAIFAEAVRKVDPGLIVVDGMSVLYGLHGLNTNDVASTDVITNWLKSITRNGRTTVIIIDHTHKGADKGSGPIGSQHKISMVQGTAIQVVPVIQPKPGAKGHVELVIGKDRPGKVREVANDDKHAVVADVFIDSSEKGFTRVSIEPPKAGDIVIAGSDEAEKKLSLRAGLAGSVEEVFRNHPGVWMARRDVSAALLVTGYSPSTFKRAFTDLVSDGIIERRGKTHDTEYRLVESEATKGIRHKQAEEPDEDVVEADLSDEGIHDVD